MLNHSSTLRFCSSDLPAMYCMMLHQCCNSAIISLHTHACTLLAVVCGGAHSDVVGHVHPVPPSELHGVLWWHGWCGEICTAHSIINVNWDRLAMLGWASMSLITIKVNGRLLIFSYLLARFLYVCVYVCVCVCVLPMPRFHRQIAGYEMGVADYEIHVHI